MATKSSCLPHLLVEKLLKHGRRRLEKNNNYLFTSSSSSTSSSPSSSSSSSSSTTPCRPHDGSAVSGLKRTGPHPPPQRLRLDGSTGAAAGTTTAGRPYPRAPHPGSRRRPLLYALVGLSALLVYANSLHGDFVHDDVVAIRRNPDVVGSSSASSAARGGGGGGGRSLARIFTDDFWGKPIADRSSHKSYRPLCVLTFRWNYQLGGLDPVGFHLVNVLLHSLACLLLTRMCERVLNYSTQLSALAGVLFATHPIHTEAVSGIVGRADVLTCVLYLTSFLLYNRSAERSKSGSGPSGSDDGGGRRAICFLLSMLTAGAALLVKEHGVTVLGVCLLYDLLVLNKGVLLRLLRGGRAATAATTAAAAAGDRDKPGSPPPPPPPLLKRACLLVVWAIFLISARVWLMGGEAPLFKPEDNPAAAASSLFTRTLTHLHVYTLNVWLLLNPTRLSYDWQMGSVPLVERLGDPRNAGSLLLMASFVLVSAAAAYRAKGLSQKRLVVALLLLVVPFTPALNLLFPVGFVIAERVLYVPSVGFILLLLQGLERLSARTNRGAMPAFYCGILLCGLWAGRTVARNKVWASREALFRSGLHSVPHNAKMHYNYANFLKDTDNREEAIKHYEEALRLWPLYASAHNNLGTLANGTTSSSSSSTSSSSSSAAAAGSSSSSAAAEWHYRRAISINPAHAGAYFNLGNLLSQRGQRQEAVAALETAIRIDRHFPDPHTSLAVLLDALGRPAEAEDHYRQVVQLRPDDANAHNNLGVFLGNQGKPEEALEVYRLAYTVDPSHHLSMVNAARQLRLFHRDSEAEVLLERALSIQRDRRTLSVVGIFYFNTDQPRRASDIFKELMTLEPDNPTNAIYYAQSLSRLGRLREAEKVLQDVTRRHPQHPEALHQLANVLGLRRKHKEALEVLQKVLKLRGGGGGGSDEEFRAAIHCQMGNHFKDIGSMQYAFQSYTKAVELNNNIGEAHLNLGVFYHLKDDVGNAGRHYSEARRLLPENHLVMENLRKMCRLHPSSAHCDGLQHT